MTARTALTFVGQVAGAFVGGPVGAAIGGMIGGTIGGNIDGPQKGPRLDDTSAPAIEFGAKVPRVYGRVWCTLSPLWWSGLRESTVNSGGKGAADSTTDQFVYHCDMLGRLADGSNVIAWTRIRIDGKIVATQLASSSAASLAASATSDRWSDVQLFSGGPTQVPWSVYEAAVGAGNASAYRDQCTFAFTNLLMPNGRNPSLIEVEVITAGTNASTSTSTSILDAPQIPDGADTISPAATLSFINPSQFAYTAGGVVLTKGSDYPDPVAIYDGAKLHANTYTGKVTISCSVSYDATLDGPTPGDVSRFFLSLSGGGDEDSFGYRVMADGVHVYTNFVRGGVGASAVDCGLGPIGTSGYVDFKIVYEAGQVEFYVGDTLVRTETAGPATVRIMLSILVANGARASQITVKNLLMYLGDAPGTAPRWIPGTVDLQTVLEAEMLRCAPLTSAHIDMSAAAGKEVYGFKASRSASAECGVLLDWYYLDIFCGDKITVVERGGAVEQTIPYGYTGSSTSGSGEPFSGLIRGADVESQFATSVQYINILADGEVDTQQGQRVGIGSEVRAVNFSIYSKPTEAKGRADTITYDTRVAAHTATIHLGAKQAARIQPASVLTLVDNKGNSYRTRVLRLVWNQGVYDVDVCLDDQNILSTVGITTEVNTSVIDVTLPAVADFLPLDIPRVSDAQNSAGYLALVKTGDATAARWFDSPDGVNYSARMDFINDAVFGSVTTASGTFNRGVSFDEASSLTVNVGLGALSSSTRAALLADRAVNAFAVGIAGRMVLGQFRTATLVSAGVYRLSGFVNMGANGTEQYCASIAAGDKFAMLGFTGTAQIHRGLADIGVPFHVKAVAFGASLGNVTAVDFTANGVNLKPLSPVLLRAARNAATGDIAISWTRRTRGDTRFGGPLGDACPLFETTELYRVRLYTNGTYATMLRDLGSPTTTTVTYASADRISDGRGLYDPIYVAVTMVSDVIGEGYPLQDAA